MTSKVTNADLMEVLGNIREDIGGLKASTSLQLEGLKNHGDRIAVLEKTVSRQKGFISGVVALAGAIGSAAGVVVHKWLSP